MITWLKKKYWRFAIMYGVPKVNLVLLFAAHLIDVKGWAKGTGETPEGAMCASVAISKSWAMIAAHTRRPFEGSSTKLHFDAITRMNSFVERETSNPHMAIVGWNDRYALSKKDVIKGLRKAAASEGHMYAI